MAITLVNAQAAAADVAESSSFELTAPSSTQDDDFYLFAAAKEDDNGNTNQPDGDTGFTIDQNFELATGSDRGTKVEYKVVTNQAGEPATYTISHAATSTRAVTATMAAFRGVDTSTPLDQTSVRTDHEANTTTPTNPAITTQTNGAWVILVCIAAPGGTTSATAPSGYTLITTDFSMTQVDLAMAYKEVATATTETPGTWTMTGAAGVTDYTLVTMALKPSGGAPPASRYPTLTLLGVG